MLPTFWRRTSQNRIHHPATNNKDNIFCLLPTTTPTQLPTTKSPTQAITKMPTWLIPSCQREKQWNYRRNQEAFTRDDVGALVGNFGTIDGVTVSRNDGPSRKLTINSDRYGYTQSVDRFVRWFGVDCQQQEQTIDRSIDSLMWVDTTNIPRYSFDRFGVVDQSISWIDQFFLTLVSRLSHDIWLQRKVILPPSSMSPMTTFHQHLHHHSCCSFKLRSNIQKYKITAHVAWRYKNGDDHTMNTVVL